MVKPERAKIGCSHNSKSQQTSSSPLNIKLLINLMISIIIFRRPVFLAMFLICTGHRNTLTAVVSF